MYPYLGDFAAGATIFVPFATYNSSGASVTITGLAVTDIEVYKGASMTQRASDAGFALVDTDGIDLDTITGIHGFTIDTSDNTDAGFYAAGNDYMVVVSSITADSQTVNFIAARFSIENRVATANVTKWLGTACATPTTAGVPEVDITHIAGAAVSTTTAQLGVNVVQISADATAADNLELFMDGTGYAGGTTPLQVTLTTNGNNAVADAVWDEATSGHVAAGSFGATLPTIRANTAQAGAATTITLDASASATDDFYNNQRIHIVAGTGAGQGRIIEDYNGTTKVATVATWAVNPSSDSVFVIVPFGSIPGASAPTAAEVADAVWDEARADHVSSGSFGQAGQVIRSATAQAGTTSSITLDASASATNDIYNYQVVYILSGTGAGQARQITDYVGASKVATVDPAFTTAPSSDSVFLILPLGIDAATVATIADAVWDEARSGHATAGTFGEYVLADATRLSGDATAADNAESFFDGTGYAGTNNVIPTVTTLTGHTAQTGDAYARLGAPAGASVSADIAAVKTDTGNTYSRIGAPAGASVSADVAAIKTETASILADTGTDGVVVAAASKTGYALSDTGIDALFTRQLTESYNTDGAAPTVSQALHGILQSLTEFGISGTTLTVRKLDGSTTAMTLTLNDGTSPTSVTRAS